MTLPDRFAAALSDRYCLERELGQGGMATVYLAEDLKHRRKVAIKVLKPELAAILGAERFLGEIQITANLQHPNLLPLFDSGVLPDEHGQPAGCPFYVMPYVEGETLRARLDREKQLPVDEAVRLATAIAGALDYAHGHGVIHRDLKPENILLQAGQPVVADFGIALAVSNAGGARVTQTGLSLGTPQYMSPEQATGDRAIDGRTDIYSLGAMTYEMLTGEPPHLGSTAQAIIAKLMTEEVRPLTVLRKAVPPHVDLAVRHALEKLAADRFATAGEFALALTGVRPIVVPTGAGATDLATAGAPPGSRARTRVLIGVLGVVAVAGVSAAAWLATRPEPVPVAGRYAVLMPDSVEIAAIGGTKVAISRDGSRMAFVGQTPEGNLALYLRRADDPHVLLVRGSEGRAGPTGYSPRFSPDGEWLLFTTPSGIRKVPAQGGSAQVLEESGAMASWGDDGRIIHSRGAGGILWIGSSEGRDARPLAVPDSAAGVYRLIWPHVLPGSTHALVTLDRAPGSGIIDSLRLGVISLTDGTISDLGLAGTDAQYSATGHIVFGRSGGLVFAAPFSLAKRRVTGPPVLVLERVWQGSGGATGFAVSDHGTLVYQESDAGSSDREVVIVTASGDVRPVPVAPTEYWNPRVSPDGRRLAIGTGATAGREIWLVDIATGGRERVTVGGETGQRPAWLRDGGRVLFLRDSGIVRDVVARTWDRSGPDRILLRDSTLRIAEVEPGPAEGSTVLRFSLGGSGELFFAPGDSLASGRPLVVSPASETSPSLSADGRLLAYVSNESDVLEVYVQPVPGPGARIQVSVGGGVEPIWSKAGTTVFYRGPQFIMRAELGGSPLRVLRRDSLFSDPYSREGNSIHQNWDVFPGDREFLMLRRSLGSVSGLFAVVNWPQLRTVRGGRGGER